MKVSARNALSCGVMMATLSLAAAVMVDSPEKGVKRLYVGLVVWAFGWAFLDAFTIGANDVANAFANAVGSKTITHRQACMIACVGEFIGVVALGKTVMDTVRKKMVNVSYFDQDPYILALGMSCVNLGSGGWVLCATLLCMPVSTTHAVVGAILGIGVAAWGIDGVKWDYDGGFLGVVASWFISPVLAAVLAAVFYLTIKYLVLVYPDEEALKRGLLYLPLYFFLAFGIVAGFMMLKGIPSLKNTPYSTTVPITIAIGIFFAILGAIFVVPWLRRTIQDKENLPYYTMFYHWSVPQGSYGYYELEGTTTKQDDVKAQAGHATPSTDSMMPSMPGMMNSGAPMMPPAPGAMPTMPMMAPGMPMQANGMPMQMYPMQPPVGVMGGAFGSYSKGEISVIGQNMGILKPVEHFPEDPFYVTIGKYIAPGMWMDIGELRPEDMEMHSKALQAAPQTEEMFKLLQLTTCLFFSISHGANDIANALAPLATVWLVFTSGDIAKKAAVPTWLLVYGAFALDVGLVTMGHYIMSALGNRLTLQSPSRGFCIEMGAMFTVMVFSRLGVPVSTTHCMTGATTGVGLCNGDLGAVNWRLLAVIFGGWLVTCPAAGCVTGLLFWGIAAAPSPTPGNGFFTGVYHGSA